MSKPPFQVRALFDYSSPHEDDLSFSGGQLLTVTDEEDDDWYFGEYNDAQGNKKEGLFPKNFVKIFEPETPPRPSRSSRSKKDLEPEQSQVVPDDPKPPRAPQANIAQSSPAAVPTSATTAKEPAVAQDTSKAQDANLTEDGEPAILPPSRRSTTEQIPAEAALPPAAPASTVTKAGPPTASKPAPPPPAEKPSSGSFRDRINAFNKSAAPPLAPVKPSGLGSSAGSGFIKKPFVAPPPSKNAYVPPPPQASVPQKVYRREEDPEMASVVHGEAEPEDRQSSIPPPTTTDQNVEDQPKPTSLKDRIALLQKQQMEQAARHAEKKEKAKKPKKHESDDPTQEHENIDGEPLEKAASRETGKKSLDSSLDNAPAKPRRSQEAAHDAGSAAVPPRELFSDTNDADQSGAGDTEEGEELSTGRDDSDEKPIRQGSGPLQLKPHATTQIEDHDRDNDGEDDEEDDVEEEEEIDPEVRRKMELRERMAKMSGGMGMAGMFGPPGALPPRTTAKQSSVSSQKKTSVDAPNNSEGVSKAPPVPLIPMPGLARVTSPESTDDGLESQGRFRREEASDPKSSVKADISEDTVERERETPSSPKAPSRTSTDRVPPPPPPSTRPVPSAPGQTRAPPPVPSERPVPTPPLPASSSHPLPPTPAPLMSPSEGSESDDELDPSAKSLGTHHGAADESDYPTAGDTATPVPASEITSSMPHRAKVSERRQSSIDTQYFSSLKQESPTVSIEGNDSAKRQSRIPPTPGSIPSTSSAPQGRAPPPPPPPSSAPAPPSRTSTTNSRAPPPIPQVPRTDDNDEEVTEYDGDYDTDLASSAPHKDALRAHARASSLEEDSMAEEASLHHSGLPSIGPIPATAPRAAPPPPPPSQPPRQSRLSSDMPRAAPPPPPPPPAPVDANLDQEDDEDDLYDQASIPGRRVPSASGAGQFSGPPKPQESEDLYSPPSTQRNAPPTQTSNIHEGYASTSNMAVPTRSAPRQSSDLQRTSTSIRRSTDIPRQSGEQGGIATDVDLSPSSRWWMQPDTPPPVFQNRRDLLFENEETSTTRRGGKNSITRTVYVLFIDYSQTIVTAHFESRDPSTATLEQHHEGPPRNLRQDQLEDAYAKFGSQIAESVNAIKETTVGDGSPHSLPFNLISALPEALLPIGVRAYGALVYANLANASVQQFDEIRPGDIITFRNARFQGHRGPMHTKYTMDVGKPDHVGIVLDWDGTKKKVRVWEQGRESRKVKPESFKLGDMRSGEVKVWRVMARTWVNWEGQN